VINLDRTFNDQSAHRPFLAGDNDKVGFNADHYPDPRFAGDADRV